VRAFRPPPERKPGGLNARILLGWIAYKSHQNAKNGGKAEQEASHLYVQQMLRFSTENQASTLLGNLRKSADAKSGPWLTVSTRSRGARGNAYRLGAACREDEAEWAAFGRQLFSPTGLLTPFLFRPILLRPPLGQGPIGCLTIGFVDAFGPVSAAEVIANLRSLMHRETIRKALGRAASMDLLLVDEGQYYAPRNLMERVRTDEINFGAREQASRLDDEIGSRQFESQLERLGGATLVRLKSMVRKMPCFYCACPTAPEGGEVEHFPPKRWGGGDDVSLLLPICTRCNKTHGAILRRTPKIPRPKVSDKPVTFSGNLEEASGWFFEFFLMRAVDYAHALNERRLEDAQESALKFFPTLIALKSGRPIVSTPTGETAPASMPHDLSVDRSTLRALDGLPRLLGRHGER